MKLWIYIFLFIPSITLSQINTEKLRIDEKLGFSGNLSIGYGMAMGNSEYLSFTPAIRIDYNTKKYINFIAATYNRKQSELKLDKVYLLAHKGFAHIRSARLINQFFSWEVFGQWEFNEFINLESRLLSGTGVRMNLLPVDISSVQLIMGIGGMFEHESYNNEEKDKGLFRSTNYLKFTWAFAEYGAFHSTTYYQFAVEEPKDFRIISDTGLKFKIVARLLFGIAATIRFDNDPSWGVPKKYDLELNNNLTMEF